jgi:hypothetical protein
MLLQWRGDKKNKASCDTSEDNNAETEDEGIEDEGDARAQPKPQKPAKPAAARATKPSAKARKPREINPQQRQESHQDQWLKRYGHRGLQEYQQPHQSARQAPCRQ